MAQHASRFSPAERPDSPARTRDTDVHDLIARDLRLNARAPEPEPLNSWPPHSRDDQANEESGRDAAEGTER